MVGSCGGSAGGEMMRGLAQKPQRCEAIGTVPQSLVIVDGQKRNMDLVFTPVIALVKIPYKNI